MLLMLLLFTAFWSCQQENPAPDVVQGDQVEVTSGDPTGDEEEDDDDDDGEDDDDD